MRNEKRNVSDPFGSRLIYATRARLQRATMQVEGKTVNLSAGMAVSVEIKTGKRRVIEYFLSPLLLHGSESLRER